MEFQRYRDKKLERQEGGHHKVSAGKVMRIAPDDWDSLEKPGKQNRTRKH